MLEVGFAPTRFLQGQKVSLLKFDQVLGLHLATQTKVKIKVPKKIKELVEQREKLRNQNEWRKADEIRKKIGKLGWKIEDTPKGVRLKKVKIE